MRAKLQVSGMSVISQLRHNDTALRQSWTVMVYFADPVPVKGMVGPLAAELGVYGIRVNSISPGLFNAIEGRYGRII